MEERTRTAVDQLIAEVLMVDRAEVRPGARLVDDLCMDSLDLAELGFSLEEVFGIDELPIATTDAWVTVADVYQTLGVEIEP